MFHNVKCLLYTILHFRYPRLCIRLYQLQRVIIVSPPSLVCDVNKVNGTTSHFPRDIDGMHPAFTALKLMTLTILNTRFDRSDMLSRHVHLNQCTLEILPIDRVVCRLKIYKELGYILIKRMAHSPTNCLIARIRCAVDLYLA